MRTDIINNQYYIIYPQKTTVVFRKVAGSRPGHVGQDVFDISTVAFAVLEVNGNLSVLLKSSEQPATAADLNVKKDKALLPLPVISDGKIIKESLEAIGTDESSVLKMLKGDNVSDIFLMTMDRDGNHSIIKQRKKQ